MSQSAPAWFETKYTDAVIHRFQGRGFKLKPTVTNAARIKGNTVVWRIAGKVAARLLNRMNLAVPANGLRTTVQATMETWQFYDIVYDDDQEKIEEMSASEMDVATESGAMGLGRAFDLQIMNEFYANAAAATAATTDTTNGLSLVKMLEMTNVAQANDMPWDGQAWCPLPSRLWNQALGYKQFNSADYIGGDLPLTKVTDTRFWNGVNWLLAPNEYFTAPAANQVDIFLWHKSAMGYGTNYEVKNNIAWEQPLTAWTTNMRMAGKAKILLTEGVIRGRFNDNATFVPT